MKVGKVLGRYKMGKHFACTIGEGSFTWSRCAELIEQKKSWMGFMCWNERADERLSAEETVRSYRAGGSRAGFPLSERDRSVGAADSASQ